VPSPSRKRRAAPSVLFLEIAVAAVGCALLAGAVLANQRWLDEHFLPSWSVTRPWYVVIESSVRVALAAAGVLLAILMRSHIARAFAAWPATATWSLVAAALALGASEVALRCVHLRAREWRTASEEPLRRADPRLGWTIASARTGHKTVGRRMIDYVIDPGGFRVRRADEPVDRDRPTILFSGESVMFGEGLVWEESVPAQVSQMIGLQSANLAVHGFSTDQQYLRLQAELPRFRRPVAVVSLFMTSVFGRNMDDDRPHLAPGLVWVPPTPHSQLALLAALFVPYRGVDEVERGVAMTREVFGAIANMARARGAAPLIVVPHFGVEPETEMSLRRRIVDDADVPYVVVELRPEWHLPWDRHPNARAAHAIAEAVAVRLRAAGVDARSR
jgi:hypothetical protein